MLKINTVILGFFVLIHLAFAEESLDSKKYITSNVTFVETESAECSISDGKLILIQNSDATKTYQVWIDRWFMNVQTPDHTKQILPPKVEPTPLGCSVARSGGNQYWTIHSVEEVIQ